MCRHRVREHCVIAGESREGWRVYKPFEGTAGEEAPELGVVQDIEHGNLRSHEYIVILRITGSNRSVLILEIRSFFFTENNHLRSSADNARGKQKGQLLHNPFEN